MDKISCPAYWLVLLLLFLMYSCGGSHQEVEELFARANDTMVHRSYLQRGDVFKMKGQYDSAAYYYHQCVDFPEIYIRGGAFLSLKRLYEQLGDTLRADAYSKQYHLRLDTILYRERTDEMSSAYLRHAVQAAVKESASSKAGWAWALALLGAGCFLYAWWRMRKRRAMRVFRRAKRQEQDLGSRWQAFQASATYQKIYRLQEEEAGNLRSKQAVSVAFSHEEQEALAAEVSAACPDWVEMLRRACPSLSEQEILYCCLAGRLGLSNFCIERCMNLATGSARQHKQRIKKKLETSKEGQKLWEQIFHKNS